MARAAGAAGSRCSNGRSRRPGLHGHAPAALLGGLTTLLAALGSLAVACAPPAGPHGEAAGAPERLYVAQALDGAVAQLDARSGRAAGPPLPVVVAPDQLVPGPGGGLLVLSAAPAHAGEVTVVALRDGTWAARPVAYGAPSGRALLAGDGRRFAAVAYQDADADLHAARCRLALVDAVAGIVAATSTVCRPGERVTALALAGPPGGGQTPTAPLAFLSVQPLAPAAPGLPAGATARVVAIDAGTGRVVAGLPLAGAPTHLVLSSGGGGNGPRVYVVEMLAPALALDDPPRASAGRLLGLDPESLEVRSVQPLSRQPLALAVAPDGERAYALISRGDPARGDGLTELDLRTGTERAAIALPGGALGLAVTATRVYAAAPERDAVWAVDRRTGRVVATLPAGRGPAALVLGPAH